MIGLIAAALFLMLVVGIFIGVYLHSLSVVPGSHRRPHVRITHETPPFLDWSFPARRSK